MNGAKIKREEIELFLRDMAHNIIGDTSIVKSIVNDVFNDMNLNSIHKSHKSKDEAKMELVSYTRKKTIEYLDTYSDFENYGAIKDNLNHLAKKFLKYNMYFLNKKAETYEAFFSVPELIDGHLEKLSNLEKEVLVRRYYFFQSSEKIAEALNITMYKVYSTIRQLVKTLWSRIICNEEIVGANTMDIVSLTKEVDDFFQANVDEKRANTAQKVSEKEIKEYFIIRLIAGSKLSDIEILFDDICLESIASIKPNDEEMDKLEYLRVFRHHTNATVASKVKKKRALYRTMGMVACLGIATLSMLLLLGNNNILVKATNKNMTYKTSSTKLGLSFSYQKIEDKVDIGIEQNYYVNDCSVPDFTEKIDTELALKVDKNNLYSEKNIVEQIVHESASKYLSLKNEGKQKYKQGDRKYVYNDVFNILFVAEFKDGVWECTKVIDVDKIDSSSKYHLDKKNVLQDFYKDSTDDVWKCELHTSKKKDTYTEIEFVRDDAKMSGLGKYRTSTMTFKRTFDEKKGNIRMTQTGELKKKDVPDDEFLTYIIDEDETIIYYNTHESGEIESSVIGTISNQVLENVAEYIVESPRKVLANIEDYNIKIPGKDVYILPYLVKQFGDTTYHSDYYENSFYEIREMEKKSCIIMDVFDNDSDYSIDAYRLYNDSYFEEINNVDKYKNIKNMNNISYFDTKIKDFKIRVFNNKYAEILEYLGKKSNVTIPTYLNGYIVKYIANEAFKYNENIKEVTIAESVLEIGKEAFKECEKLKKVVIKGNVVSIGEEAYEGCKELKEIKIKESLKYVGKDCFDGTKFLEKLEEKDNVIYLGKTALKLTSDVKELKLKSSTLAIADDFLDGHGEKISEIVIPNSVKYIGESAFEDAKNAATITMGAEVKYIGAKAFKGCSKVNTIRVPSTVQVLNEEVFADCIGLRMIEGVAGVKAIKKNAFRGTNKECKMSISPSTICVFE